MTLTYNCPLCLLDPYNHSLKKLAVRENTYIYYACPSEAKMYNDTEGILNHYEGVLSEIPEDKEWIWIFDSHDFFLKHYLQIDVGIGLAKLITNKFSKNLKKIIIINPTFYISSTYTIVRVFLNDDVRNKVKFNYNYKTASELLENINL